MQQCDETAIEPTIAAGDEDCRAEVSGNCWAHLAAERGLAENSLHAYRRDLENLSDFLIKRSRTLFSAEARDFREYLHAAEPERQIHACSGRAPASRLSASCCDFSPGEDGKSASILQQLERFKAPSSQSLPKILSRRRRSTSAYRIASQEPELAALFSRDVAIL